MTVPILCNENSETKVISMLDNEIVKIGQWHCRKCHHNWYPRSPKIPPRCANEECKTMKWNRWPKDFDIQKCTCIDCLYMHKREQELKTQSETKRAPRKPKVNMK